ncbi:START domain-containing protein 10-like [Ornithodoros turicata]|uniref:START domain-containing protein 10-like n=1 Tax=Ornithodoros turicata TaxID=34597 RepID=UPI003138A5B3
MDVGEVRVADDRDFEQLKRLTDKHEGWKVEYSKRQTTVWTRPTEQTAFKMIKLHTTYKDLTAGLLFDVMMDPGYRKKWDVYMLESYDIGCLNPNNDIGYYAVRSPPPLRNRDFVLQRSWLETKKEILVLNHSVFHESAPPRRGFVRATSYLTGFVIRPSADGRGCHFTYVTQCDPKGTLPAWFVNKLTQIFAPKMAKRVGVACQGYASWKAKNNPNVKPWLFPEQATLPKLDLARCCSVTDDQEELDLDESSVAEDSFNGSTDFLELDAAQK